MYFSVDKFYNFVNKKFIHNNILFNVTQELTSDKNIFDFKVTTILTSICKDQIKKSEQTYNEWHFFLKWIVRDPAPFSSAINQVQHIKQLNNIRVCCPSSICIHQGVRFSILIIYTVNTQLQLMA